MNSNIKIADKLINVVKNKTKFYIWPSDIFYVKKKNVVQLIL